MTARREALLVIGAMALGVLTVVVSSLWLGPVARRMPLVVAVPTLVLLLFELERVYRGAEAPPVSRRTSTERVMFGWIGVLLTTSVLLGMTVGLPIFLLAYMRAHFRESWRTALVLSAATALLLAVGLDYLLGVPLYAGLLANWFEAAP